MPSNEIHQKGTIQIVMILIVSFYVRLFFRAVRVFRGLSLPRQPRKRTTNYGMRGINGNGEPLRGCAAASLPLLCYRFAIFIPHSAFRIPHLPP